MDNSTLVKPFKTINPWHMLGWLLVAQVMVAFIGRSLAPLGVLIGEDLLLTKAQIGMLPAALFLGQSIASIPAGFIVDRIGSKRLLLYLSFGLGGAFMLMAISSNYFFVLLMVAIGGVGYGTMHPTSNKGILHWFVEKRGTAMGIKQMGVTLGSALSALLLLPLAAAWGWRMALLAACALLMATGVLAYRFYRDPPSAEPHEPERQISWSYLKESIGAMFRHKPLVLLSIAAMGLSGSQLILNTYIVLFAYEQLGLSLLLAGMLLVISEVSGSFGRVAWGIISDTIFKGQRLIVLVYIAALSIGIALVVTRLPEGISFWAIASVVAVFGFCISGFNGIWMNAATELVPFKQAGIASGFTLMVGSWGVIIGPPLFGYIVDLSGDFNYGWFFLSFVLLFVIVLLLWAKRLANKETQHNKGV